jgi:TnpA family transposase
VSTILIGIFGTGGYVSWRVDRCSPAKNAGCFSASRTTPTAAIWGDGTTSSSDGQFFRSAKRGDAAGNINARYGRDPGVSFYTHLSDQHGPYSIKVMSATNHEAPYVLDGLLTLLKIDTHYTDTGGASDHLFILCALLGFRFCPRLRDLPERKLACIAPASTYPFLEPLLGHRIKADVIRGHWSEIIRLVASLKAGRL